MATLFTRLVDDTGVGVGGAIVEFRRRWSPQARVGSVTVQSRIIVSADHLGFLNVSLLGGSYRIWLPGAAARLITVPDDDGTYLLEDLLGITGGTVALTYRYRAGALELINGTTGQYHGFRITGAELPQLSIDAIGDPSPNYRWIEGTLQILNVDTEAWHAIHLTGAGPQFAIATAGELLTGNARTASGRLSLLNTTTDLYHPIYLSGASPGWVFGAGVE